MKHRLKIKEVDVVYWKDDASRIKAEKKLIELGCKNVRTTYSGAGTMIIFDYLVGDKNYNCCLPYIARVVFFENEKPEIYNSIDFCKLFEEGRVNEISDGYHTFDELYEFRKLYNAGFFNSLAESSNVKVYKSKKHHDGELCFGGGWFIVVAELPTGQISNHYKEKDWDLFKIPEVEKSLIPFDGHTSTDVIQRLKDYILLKHN